MTAAVETWDLTKIYPGGGGCADISLRVDRGEVFGLLGPNGAGKSTFVKTLLGLLLPTSGRAALLGRPLGDPAARQAIGFLPENFRFHEWMTGGELLSFHAALYGLTRQEARQRIPQVLDLVRLPGVEKKRVGAFSKGMQQRLGLAAALLPRPSLLFLDEPTSALDPIGRKEVRDIMADLQAQGTTVFLNSHLLSEVEMVCTRVAFIRQGRVVADGTLDQLLGGGVEVELEVGGLDSQLLECLRELTLSLRQEGRRLVCTLNRSEDIPALAAAVVSGGGQLYALKPRRHTLEELFIDLVGKGEDHGR